MGTCRRFEESCKGEEICITTRIWKTLRRTGALKDANGPRGHQNKSTRDNIGRIKFELQETLQFVPGQMLGSFWHIEAKRKTLKVQLTSSHRRSRETTGEHPETTCNFVRALRQQPMGLSDGQRGAMGGNGVQRTAQWCNGGQRSRWGAMMGNGGRQGSGKLVFTFLKDLRGLGMGFFGGHGANG